MAGPGDPPRGEDPEEAKARLQRRVDDARDAISETVGAIKGTVEDQYATAKDAVTGVLGWREGFQREPIVWSIGALTAGFALGYSLGTSERKGTRAGAHAGLGTLADTLVRELGTLGSHLPPTALETFERVVGVDLAKLFAEMGEGAPRPRSARRRPKQGATASPARKRRTRRSVPRSRPRVV